MSVSRLDIGLLMFLLENLIFRDNYRILQGRLVGRRNTVLRSSWTFMVNIYHIRNYAQSMVWCRCPWQSEWVRLTYMPALLQEFIVKLNKIRQFWAEEELPVGSFKKKQKKEFIF